MVTLPRLRLSFLLLRLLRSSRFKQDSLFSRHFRQANLFSSRFKQARLLATTRSGRLSVLRKLPVIRSCRVLQLSVVLQLLLALLTPINCIAQVRTHSRLLFIALVLVKYQVEFRLCLASVPLGQRRRPHKVVLQLHPHPAQCKLSSRA